MANEKGTYLYAVVSDLGESAFGPIGIDETEVYSIANKDRDLIAIVSDVPTKEELRPERRNLAAHQRVLRKAVDGSRVVLPVSFGTVADDADGVRTLLEHYENDFRTQMRRVEGKVQMSARTYYNAAQPSVFEFFVGKSPNLARARDRLLSMGQAPSRDAKIEVGQAFEQVLDEAREQYASQLESALAPFCSEIKHNKPRNEQEMVRLACLVPKGKEAEFESALEKAARKLPDEFAIEPNGPFPPYDFVELRLKVPGK